MPVTRFAPSPTGLLHIGHAYSARFAWETAEDSPCLLRIEDIDQERCRPEYEEAIFEDLRWLGFSWPEPVVRQSERIPLYMAALDKLHAKEVLYPCFCTRQEIQRELSRMGSAPHCLENAYPGTCRNLSRAEREEKMASGLPYAWRLDMERALTMMVDLKFRDLLSGTYYARPDLFGDAVIARKDSGLSYHLCVVVDDHDQGVEIVTRGEDLFGSTHLHCMLQQLLEIPPPLYKHHDLVEDENGIRLAKRTDAVAIKTLREQGWTQDQIWRKASNNLSSGTFRR